jgi:uncharacterized membrane protein YcaP (DUF421 family)
VVSWYHYLEPNPALFVPSVVENTLQAIFGIKDHLSLGQECARAVLIFVYGLIMLRLSGHRTFAHWSALDIIISIVAGSSLSRALTGSAPLPGTLAAVAVLVFLHLIFAYAVARSASLSRFIEGAPVLLIKHGVVDEKVRLWQAVSKIDIEEALREKQLEGLDELAKVRSMRIEPSGKLSVTKEKDS